MASPSPSASAPKPKKTPSSRGSSSSGSFDLSSLASALPVKDCRPKDRQKTKVPELPVPIVTHFLQLKGTIETYRPSAVQISRLKLETQNQSSCPVWFEHRAGRITSSVAHDVKVRRSSTDPKNLVKKILGLGEDLGKIPQVRWGTQNEEKARVLYTKQQKSKHRKFTCDKSGFLIDIDNPFLGVSSDGEVNCSCCGRGVLEIKCPYKHRDATISEALADPHFCLNSSGHLKAAHRYFTQVQLHMHVHRVAYCDFFVYTRKDSHCHRVRYDKDFCEKLVESAENFFEDHVRPAILRNDKAGVRNP
ncbi:uncharacterized protein LOC143032159 [Oratosquilla oratoria]|uniref:uncharacterized protein LOC143032159 n=1 Tax=Oratosquilla oratoria TaxID=337810 RepID=UPI003F769CF8